MTKLDSKITSLKTEMLLDMAKKLNNDFRDGSDLVMSAVMDELMTRLSVAEFVAFCETLNNNFKDSADIAFCETL